MIRKWVKKILCAMELHRPLGDYHYAFTDQVNGGEVFYATCECGKKWLTQSLNPFIGYRVQIRLKKPK